MSAFSLVLVASCSFWAMFDYGCTVLPCQIEAECCYLFCCWHCVHFVESGLMVTTPDGKIIFTV